MGDPAIMVGLSGGVDSSVAALLLSRRGLPVQGLFMKNWEEDDRDGACPAEQDARDAEGVARQLGIGFHTRNFATEYWDGVFEAFLAEHRAGRTPNPDVLCNREIKFRTFLEHAEDLGAGRIATGHYARVVHGPGGARLLRGLDPGKDQSYFLHAIPQHALARTLFPVGELPKSQVRAIAREAGLATHDKKDSTGICFIGERDFRGFLARFIEPRPGDIVDPAGRRVGRHDGLAFHTLGQRGGLGIGGVRGRGEAPWYVVGKDTAQNRLIVDQDHDSPWLMSRTVQTEPAAWIAGAPPRARFEAGAQCRYRQPAQDCAVEVLDDGRLVVRFLRPQRAVTPGQSLVVYDGETCLGGAVIAATDAAWGGLSAPPACAALAVGAAR
jgi:tRNA-specific 2-thiouridylase